MTISISVVIAAFNAQEVIDETLKSVLQQTPPPTEVIVVDDGSTDDTKAIVRGHKGVKLIEQSNAGPGAARNAGVAFASGQYVAFIDSDDVWLPWTLATIQQALASKNHPTLVAAKLQEFHKPDELSQIVEEPISLLYFEDYYACHRQRLFVGAGMMTVQRAAFEAVGGFSERRMYAEDLDLGLRLGEYEGFVQILTPTTLAYRRHPSSARADLAMIYVGCMHLLTCEKKGQYPGGLRRIGQRRSLISSFLRPVAIQCAQAGQIAWAVDLYMQTFAWHLMQCRFRFLLFLPYTIFYNAIAKFCRRDRSS